MENLEIRVNRTLVSCGNWQVIVLASVRVSFMVFRRKQGQQASMVVVRKRERKGVDLETSECDDVTSSAFFRLFISFPNSPL